MGPDLEPNNKVTGLFIASQRKSHAPMSKCHLCGKKSKCFEMEIAIKTGEKNWFAGDFKLCKKCKNSRSHLSKEDATIMVQNRDVY